MGEVKRKPQTWRQGRCANDAERNVSFRDLREVEDVLIYLDYTLNADPENDRGKRNERLLEFQSQDIVKGLLALQQVRMNALRTSPEQSDDTLLWEARMHSLGLKRETAG